MGDDDANEGYGPGECIEHLWRVRGAVFSIGAGAQVESECTRCTAIRIE